MTPHLEGLRAETDAELANYLAPFAANAPVGRVLRAIVAEMRAMRSVLEMERERGAVQKQLEEKTRLLSETLNNANAVGRRAEAVDRAAKDTEKQLDEARANLEEAIQWRDKAEEKYVLARKIADRAESERDEANQKLSEASREDYRSEVCRKERAEHQKTKNELSELREQLRNGQEAYSALARLCNPTLAPYQFNVLDKLNAELKVENAELRAAQGGDAPPAVQNGAGPSEVIDFESGLLGSCNLSRHEFARAYAAHVTAELRRELAYSQETVQKWAGRIPKSDFDDVCDQRDTALRELAAAEIDTHLLCIRPGDGTHIMGAREYDAMEKFISDVALAVDESERHDDYAAILSAVVALKAERDEAVESQIKSEAAWSAELSEARQQLDKLTFQLAALKACTKPIDASDRAVIRESLKSIARGGILMQALAVLASPSKSAPEPIGYAVFYWDGCISGCFETLVEAIDVVKALIPRDGYRAPRAVALVPAEPAETGEVAK